MNNFPVLLTKTELIARLYEDIQGEMEDRTRIERLHNNLYRMGPENLERLRGMLLSDSHSSYISGCGALVCLFLLMFGFTMILGDSLIQKCQRDVFCKREENVVIKTEEVLAGGTLMFALFTGVAFWKKRKADTMLEDIRLGAEGIIRQFQV